MGSLVVLTRDLPGAINALLRYTRYWGYGVLIATFFRLLPLYTLLTLHEYR